MNTIMKKWIIALLFAGAAMTASAQVQFENAATTDALRQMAIKTNKLVFIDLYASWCPPCKMMERDVFSREDVGKFMNERFVSAKFDVDQKLGGELMKLYGTGSIPCYLVFDTKGELLGRIVGASAPDELMRDLRKVIDKQKKTE